ncbi:MAG TPA: excinuclease ABC subunit UvrC [Bacteroidales bacterium]|nr:excinuclease ABC subunit UvrC [Bacteroidales bacterium]
MSEDRSKYHPRLKPLLASLPDKPGVYQYFDEDGKIIYVGKAKSLKKRVSSYFTKDSSGNGKLRVLVSRIADIRHIVVNTEFDALLLENNLIKEHQPRYNIQLKDDKTFPWICIRNEPFPRIYSTRNPVKDGSEYFGPYASVRMMRTLLELIRQLFPLRTCNLSLSPANISSGKFRRCLEYHIGNCLAPCEGLEQEDTYLERLAQIRHIIRGNTREVIQGLREKMMALAERMEFEKAQQLKEKLEILERYQARSTVVSASITNVDVCSILTDDTYAYVNFLRVMNGAVVQSHTLEIRKKLDEPAEELLGLALAELRQRYASVSPEVILSNPPDIGLPGVVFHIPQRGDKKKLLELSERNAAAYRMEREKQRQLVDPDRRSRRLMEQIKKDLQLEELPQHIECFDNSNFHGDYPVAAMVVFRDGRPSKKEYRHYNIRTVEGPDDFASMEEIIHRRYRRLLDEGATLPQLIVVDGGKGQLGAAVKSLRLLGLERSVKIIGIAKKLEELYRPGDPLPLYLDKNSETLRLIQRMRDEAHRFGITHHRKRRDKGTLKTELTGIPGIGPATSAELLRHFKSVKKVKEASPEALSELLGPAKAAKVWEHFHGGDGTPNTQQGIMKEGNTRQGTRD